MKPFQLAVAERDIEKKKWKFSLEQVQMLALRVEHVEHMELRSKQ